MFRDLKVDHAGPVRPGLYMRMNRWSLRAGSTSAVATATNRRIKLEAGAGRTIVKVHWDGRLKKTDPSRPEDPDRGLTLRGLARL